ncbi:uncharacterized protein B0P05DRAFT_215063 [Gilbertella persicaria]|uniref:uncharacterized protein n=1 Tax=Gilbertella persicaria TaxID=101096 RepID=UPI00221F81AA|nr:uncharacterized protein B0P05DRAFT_215063 [Gilbertella persicaria]KAI8065367.1 hypothetical protein B0P05DRAFT_215063 [Gilbertella persicaria]
MSEPQTKPTEDLMQSTQEQQEITHNEQAPASAPELSGPLKTLKDAFPDLDIEIIQTILDSQGGNLDSAFEVLLGMSDPSYKPEPGQVDNASQLQQDEAYARQLAREGDAHYPQNNNVNRDNEPLFNFQELPMIKEKVIEAGTAAKNKIMNLYNQFMASTSEQPREPNRNNTRLADNNDVDLYGSDPTLNVPRHTTSTPKEQLRSDEDFARQLALNQDTHSEQNEQNEQTEQNEGNKNNKETGAQMTI